jgi:tetratricopeptide (TPR) repeat protein
MARPNPRKLPFAPMAGALAAQAEEALRLGRFKEAVELYKQLLKQEARPEWRDALADAYVGRAKALFAKGLFKEAEIVLGNAAALDGAVKEPLFLISCLVRQGQLDKALAQGLKHVGTDALEPGEGRLLSELTAAMFLARPVPLAVSDGDPPARVEWIAAANAARNALAALTAQKPADEIEPFIAAIPARSPFGPVRLIVKSLIIDDPAKARRLVEGVPQASPFGPLRLAAEATLPAESAEVVGRLNEASPAQRAFALEWLGASANGPSMLARLLDAKGSGPGQLFAFLTRQPMTLPAADVRNACFNLLPQIPDRIVPFERAFRKLSEAEKARILALAAEAKQDWPRAETHWRAAAAAFAQEGSSQARLSAGVIYRHLSALAQKEPSIAGDGMFAEPVVSYLRKSLDCDPDYLPATLELIKLYREGGDEQHWHALADEAAERFPTESAVLMQAIESATARKAFKKAAGFAKKLLSVDPINRPARQRMIELKISHARKQMRAKRPDLASNELAAAGEWERADAPNADLRINQGLVGLRGGQDPQAEARLREGVDLAGGGAVGWFRAALQDALMARPQERPAAPVGEELARALRGAPAKPEIVAIAALLSAPDVRADPKATSEAGWKFGNWIRQATHAELSAAEFHAVADALLRAQLYDVLREFALAGRRRDPDERFWRFYEIVARTQNDPNRMTFAEEAAIEEICGSRAIAEDRLGRARIESYLDGSGDDPDSKRRARRREAEEEAESFDMLEDVLSTFLDAVPRHEVAKLARARRREAAVSSLADRLGKLPLGGALPRQMLEMVAKTMVAAALGDTHPPF